MDTCRKHMKSCPSWPEMKWCLCLTPYVGESIGREKEGGGRKEGWR